MDEPEVMELIEYCRELEGNVMEIVIDKQYDKEEILFNVVRDIYNSCKDTLREEEDSVRFGETPRVDFEKTILNLKKYIESINKLYSINL
jgi:hypothetical protein